MEGGYRRGARAMTDWRNPLVWLLALLAPAGLLLCGLWGWAIIDRTPPLQYLSSIEAKVDADDRLLTLRWMIRRERYCPGNVYRILKAEIGGTIYLSTAGIDVNADSPEQQAARIGTTYPGRETVVELPRSVGGHVEFHNRIEAWCNPMQEWWPIVVESPVVSFELPKPG